MNTIECIEVIIRNLDEMPILFSNGFISRYGYKLLDRKCHFYPEIGK
ncbi:MAG: hypothetical protein AB1422_04305 [bacterium]